MQLTFDPGQLLLMSFVWLSSNLSGESPPSDVSQSVGSEALAASED